MTEVIPRLKPELIHAGYALLSAAAYVGATVAMKYYDRLSFLQAAILILGCLAGAVFFETIALRTGRLGMILLLILGFECAIGLLLSWGWFREAYTLKEIVGLALIVAGVGIASS